MWNLTDVAKMCERVAPPAVAAAYSMFTNVCCALSESAYSPFKRTMKHFIDRKIESAIDTKELLCVPMITETASAVTGKAIEPCLGAPAQQALSGFIVNFVSKNIFFLQFIINGLADAVMGKTEGPRFLSIQKAIEMASGTISAMIADYYITAYEKANDVELPELTKDALKLTVGTLVSRTVRIVMTSEPQNMHKPATATP